MTTQIKNLNLISILFIALLSLTLTSCSTEDANDLTDVDNFTNSIENRGDNAKGGKCFSLVFPVTINIGGEETTFEDQESLREAKQAYKEEAGEDAERPTLVFPVTIENMDGEQTEIASEEEFAEIKEACNSGRNGKGSKGKGGKCFSLVYPVTVNIGGEEITFEDQESLSEAKQAYKEEAGEDAEKPTLVFPISIEYADGTTANVDSQEALMELKEACGGDREGRDRGQDREERCFELVFPLTLDFDGTEMTFEDRASLKEAKKAYREEAGDDAERPALVFPVTIEYADGTQADIANEEELEAAKENCDND